MIVFCFAILCYICGVNVAYFITLAKIYRMNITRVTPFIDKYHPKNDNERMVSIRVTFQRVKKYYRTSLRLKPSYFEKIMTSKRKTEAENKIYNQILSYHDKAVKIADDLPIFTFSKFKEKYYEHRNTTDSVFFAFDEYIHELKEEGRIGTAVSYQTAKASLHGFTKDLKFADVTTAFLKKYEAWMLNNKKTTTTVGIYLRNLRAIFNRANIDKSLSPFGAGQQKYLIPKGNNFKKALPSDAIKRIYNYKPEPKSLSDMAKDYWIFIYLCGGINVKDLCLLQNKNIDDNVLRYERAKTKLSKNNGEKINVSLKPQAIEIIKKWGQPSINLETYIFPHLQKGMTAENERKIIQQLTKKINKYMGRITVELGLPKVTTYHARHSFATVLRNSEVKMELISKALGHTSMKTTESYLAEYPMKMLHDATDSLLDFDIEN